MLLFCPSCGTRLSLEEGSKCYRFSCPTCPYVMPVTKKLSSRRYPVLKEVDEVLSDSSAWQNVDATDERCPKCEHPRAFFMQMQTRSADEPMTTFYRCCNNDCQYRWKE